MAVDGKYGQVTLERGTIGEDEPVVVFRAQDEALPAVLAWYRDHCARLGSPERHLSAIDDAAASVISWQAGHPTKVPESAGYQGGGS